MFWGQRLQVAAGTIVVGSLVLALVDFLLDPSLVVVAAFFLGAVIGILNYVAWRIITLKADVILWAVVVLTALGGTLVAVASCSPLRAFGMPIPLASASSFCTDNTCYKALVYNFSLLWVLPLVYWLYARVSSFRAYLRLRR